NEPHPRGQYNARVMAGWVCSPGAWTEIFTNPNLAKHSEPCVEDVDFPRVAMSQAHWDGNALVLAASACNDATDGTRTSTRVRRLPIDGEWHLTAADGTSTNCHVAGGEATIELTADGSTFILEVT
ncbi:MAG: hypothetical protein QF637_09705, partial [Acidimicrobiales bacterium]|nr:hypothetical protein [Acidimicrobiales bacterium]